MKSRLMTLATLLLLSACSWVEDVQTGKLETGGILFDAYEVDNTWGYELTGFYIDASGTVWRYRRDEPWFPAEQRVSVVKPTDLMAKFNDAEEVGTIPADVLTEKKKLIKEAAKGPITRDRISMERSGRLVVAYLFESRRGRFEVVFLDSGGNWVAKNHSAAARDLARWLRQVEEEMVPDEE